MSTVIGRIRAWPRTRYARLLVAILLVGAITRAVWRRQLVDPGIGGDGLHYWHLAVHMDRDHLISLDGKTPSWTRLPGYSALLALTTRPGISDTGPQDPISIRDRVWAWRDRMTIVNLTIDLACGLFAALLALALGAGPWSLLAAAWWSVQPWSTVIAIHPLSDGFATLLTAVTLFALARAMRDKRAALFAVAGGAAALTTLVRGDGLLLLPVVLGGAVLAAPRLRESPRFVIASALAFALVFAPWPIRNYAVFGEPHVFGGTNIDKDGMPLDRGAVFRWFRTWTSGLEDETVRVAWPFPSQRLPPEAIPPQAFHDQAERAAVVAIIDEYNRRGARLDPDLAARLDGISAARRARSPLDFWVRLPLLRIKHAVLAPHDGFAMGTLPVITFARAAWVWADRAVAACAVLALLLLARRPKRRAIVLVIGAWLIGRAVAITVLMPVPEPRYFIEFLPIFAAAAATLPRAWSPGKNASIPPAAQRSLSARAGAAPG